LYPDFLREDAKAGHLIGHDVEPPGVILLLAIEIAYSYHTVLGFTAMIANFIQQKRPQRKSYQMSMAARVW
jgi:hypothetical protein